MKKIRLLSAFLVTLVAITRLQAVDTINTGKQPEAGLVQGDDLPAHDEIPAMRGVLRHHVGRRSFGGTGTVFQVTDSGQLTTLVNFTGTGPDRGEAPVAALIHGTDGSFYGTTYSGGTSNLGTVFKMTVTTTTDGMTTAVLTTLADFTGIGTTRGENPTTGLLEDPMFPGTFYGTTTHGGTNDAGTIFMIAGASISTVADFNGVTASDPESSLIKARDGKFYGTTAQGGTFGFGTVYSFNGSIISGVLHAFAGPPDEGAAPYTELVQGLGVDTALYGTTSAGGDNFAGTIFSVNPNGTFRSIYSFDPIFAGPEGSAPFAGLAPGTDTRSVSFYGTTFTGGTDNFGTIFQILVNPGPTSYAGDFFKRRSQ